MEKDILKVLVTQEEIRSGSHRWERRFPRSMPIRIL